ncbi:DUF6660 family protein [Sinomicrobium oceani]|uniref:DUF6660 family protein n=1 Tax=Sinomicrobium oceani TaxID=1150368 RepID=UPI0009303FA5
MKIACYILSFYFMALTGVACADTVPQYEQDGITVVDAGNNDHHHNTGDGWDGCSPFCVCHCCHLHFLYTSPDLVFTYSEKQPALYSSYIRDFRSIKIFDFLKPPRS